jgi:hypothetical protein
VLFEGQCGIWPVPTKALAWYRCVHALAHMAQWRTTLRRLCDIRGATAQTDTEHSRLPSTSTVIPTSRLVGSRRLQGERKNCARYDFTL